MSQPGLPVNHLIQPIIGWLNPWLFLCFFFLNRASVGFPPSRNTRRSICSHTVTGWWVGTFFPYIGNKVNNWLIFCRGVETTNQSIINIIKKGNYGIILVFHIKTEHVTARPHTLGYHCGYDPRHFGYQHMIMAPNTQLHRVFPLVNWHRVMVASLNQWVNHIPTVPSIFSESQHWKPRDV